MKPSYYSAFTILIIPLVLSGILFCLLILALITSNRHQIHSKQPNTYSIQPPPSLSNTKQLQSLYCGFVDPPSRYFVWYATLVSKNEAPFTHNHLLYYHPNSKNNLPVNIVNAITLAVYGCDIGNAQVTNSTRQIAFMLTAAMHNEFTLNGRLDDVVEAVYVVLAVVRQSSFQVCIQDTFRLLVMFWTKVREPIVLKISELISTFCISTEKIGKIAENVKQSDFGRIELRLLLSSLFARWVPFPKIFRVWDCLVVRISFFN